MTRKPSRHRQPPTFSSFGRTTNLFASTSTKKMSSSELDRTVPSESGGNLGKRLLKDTLDKNNESSESSSDEDNGGTVQLDFDFFSPKPDDFHGVKVLLQTYLDDKKWDLSGFVDLILEQATVGTVVKIEDEEDENDDCLYSIVTALNLSRYKGNKCFKELNDYLLRVCDDKDVIGDLQILLGEQAQDVGLLVSKHVINFPPELLPPLYSTLFDEVAQAAKKERKNFSFKVYLLITRIYRHKNADHQKKTSKVRNDEPVIYVWPEDEIFHKLSLWSFTFPLRSRPADEMKNYKPMGLVMAIEANKIPTFQQELQSLIT